jgi:histidinol phosphatase-like enzyme
MLYQAAQDHQLDLSKCVVIGDRWLDMVAAHEAGCYKILVLTGAGE